MKVLVAHNRYQQAGGEDAVFAAEVELLRRAGYQVIEYVRSNDEISRNGFASRSRLAWSSASTGRAVTQQV